MQSLRSMQKLPMQILLGEKQNKCYFSLDMGFQRTGKKQVRQSSGALTRSLFRRMGFRIENVESVAFHGGKKDFFGFIDDIAFCNGQMIGLQSCLSTDLLVHKRKYQALLAENAPIVEWGKHHDLWLVCWLEKDKNWYPQIEILTESKNLIDLATKLTIVK